MTTEVSGLPQASAEDIAALEGLPADGPTQPEEPIVRKAQVAQVPLSLSTPPEPPTAPAPVLLYFHKQGPRNFVFTKDAKRIKWEEHPGDLGMKVLDEVKDAAEVADLRGYIEKRAGGVTEISREEYEFIKKNPAQKRTRSLYPQLRTFDPNKVVQEQLFKKGQSPSSATDAKAPNAARLAGALQAAQGAAAPAPLQRPSELPPHSGRKITPRVGTAPKPAAPAVTAAAGE